jgi:hypothetical protein
MNGGWWMRLGKMEIALELALSPINFKFMNSMLPASDFSAHRNPVG